MWSINAGDSDLTFGLPADGQNMPSKAKPKKSKKKKPIGQVRFASAVLKR